MVSRFFIDDQFREAFRGVFKAKSISVYWCIILCTPLDMYLCVVTANVSFISIEETMKLYCALHRS